MTSARWTNGRRSVTGCWSFNWPGGYFTIVLDSMDRITKRKRCFRVYGDRPEWGCWKREGR